MRAELIKTVAEAVHYANQQGRYREFFERARTLFDGLNEQLGDST